MKIEIWSDFACPFCYIGKTRFEQALNEFKNKKDVEVTYKAYQLNPYAPKTMEGSAYEAFAKGHNMTVKEAKDRFKMFEQNAKSVGLTYNYDIIQMTNTFDAHRLAKYAATKNLEDKLTNRLMKAYFTDGLNLADHATLEKLAVEIGLDQTEAKEVLASNKYKDEVQGQIDEARKVGVQGVPFFVINRKYGVSGAQQKEYFTQVLEQIWKEDQPLQTMNDSDESQSCNDEGCEF
ncbi:MAG: DsbA family oxidoreductase [Acholeplasmataceae bacterium]|nr:DsbA family oxidoreductase [Acholeplasmataceae bacterium]